jgi:hypothetical protein
MIPREISITPVLNGFIVRVGCQNLVMKTPDELGQEIARYYKEPVATEKAYIANKVNSTLDNGRLACPTSDAGPEPTNVGTSASERMVRSLAGQEADRVARLM